jgi:hypothetical protein
MNDIPTIDLTDLKTSKKNDSKIAVSQGMNSTQKVEGNYLIDINITINLNLGDKIDPSTLEQANNLIDKLLQIKKKIEEGE